MPGKQRRTPTVPPSMLPSSKRLAATCTHVLILFAFSAEAAEPPLIQNPRQTSGDKASQPKWDESLTITVGTKDADIIGSDQRAIQAAVDHVARLGGGTVRILAGEYRLRNAVYLQSNVNLIGEGDRTRLVKEPS